MQKYIGIIIAILIMTFAIIRLLPASSPVLTVAICADSYWGVPDGHPTAVWEEAIEKFKTQHPNIQVKLITGVQKADYGEWLAGLLTKPCYEIIRFLCHRLPGPGRISTAFVNKPPKIVMVMASWTLLVPTATPGSRLP